MMMIKVFVMRENIILIIRNTELCVMHSTKVLMGRLGTACHEQGSEDQAQWME